MSVADLAALRPVPPALRELAQRVERHCHHWPQPTAVPRLELVTSHRPAGPFHELYRPMVCFVAAGAKETIAGDRRQAYGAGSFLLSAVEVPVTFSIVEGPYRAAVLHLDATVVADLLLELGELAPERSPAGRPAEAVTAHPMGDQLLDAVLRLVGLLDAPEDLGVLAPRIEGEVLLRLLRSPAGPAIRQFGLADSRLAHVRAAAQWIRDHLDEPLNVRDLADVAAMSVASLHRHFRAATGMTPGRFHRRLRLQAARSSLLAGTTTAAAAAARVGYSSAARFTRDYAAEFGLPPAEDARRLRRAAGAAS